MFHYLAVLNFKGKKPVTVTIEIDKPIHNGEIICLEPDRFVVTEIKHIISEKGSSTYLDCDQCN